MNQVEDCYVEVTLNNEKVKTTERAISKSVLQTADVIRSNVVQSRVIPFDAGTLQNSTHIGQISDIEAYIEQSTPYARKMYYGDDYDFQTVNNENARSRWYSDFEDEKGLENTTNILLQFIKRNSGGIVE